MPLPFADSPRILRISQLLTCAHLLQKLGVMVSRKHLIFNAVAYINFLLQKCKSNLCPAALGFDKITTLAPSLCAKKKEKKETKTRNYAMNIEEVLGFRMKRCSLLIKSIQRILLAVVVAVVVIVVTKVAFISKTSSR